MDRICTIIAQNYLPQAMALLESSRNIYPDIEFFVLMTDTNQVDHSFLPTATILTLADVKIPPSWLEDMKTYYDPVEFATALKPFLLSTLLAEGVRTVTFLDPDILLYSELNEGMDAAAQFGIALTPHRLTPSNILKPEYNELGFLQYGIFNLGYICVGQSGKMMLEWWSERLRWYCTRFPNHVVFTDQKWMNFVPALFNFKVIRNFGYDFAPWNIDERPLRLEKGKYIAGDSPLVFIHFSQMSAGLALGKETDLWNKAITNSESDTNSLQLILKLTASYSSTLVAFRIRLSQKPTQNNVGIDNPLFGFYKRQKLIQRTLYLARTNEVRLKTKTTHHRVRPLLTSFAKKLEKSATFNGVRAGLSVDLAKIAQRLRNLLHK